MDKIELILNTTQICINIAPFDMENQIILGDIDNKSICKLYDIGKWFEYQQMNTYFPYDVQKMRYIFEPNKIYCGIVFLRDFHVTRAKYNIYGSLDEIGKCYNSDSEDDNDINNKLTDNYKLYYAETIIEEEWTSSTRPVTHDDEKYYPLYCITDDKNKLDKRYEWVELDINKLE